MSETSSTGSTTRDVEFTSDGITLRGWLRLPTGDGPHPLVILAHGLGGIKEMTNIPDVADAVLGAGMAAMAFDYRNFGDSDGLPREDVDHCGQIEDWQNAITFARTLPEIDDDRIGIWGTSLGGRNVLAVAALDHRIAAVVSQVPLIKLSPELAVFMTGSRDLDDYHKSLEEDRRNRVLGKAPRYVTWDPEAGPSDSDDQVASFSEECLRKWKRRHTFRAIAPNLANDVIPLMKQISPTPLLMILAEGDVLPGQRQAYEEALEPKSLLLHEGHHYSVYTTWNEQAVTRARDWFAAHLTSN